MCPVSIRPNLELILTLALP